MSFSDSDMSNASPNSAFKKNPTDGDGKGPKTTKINEKTSTVKKSATTAKVPDGNLTTPEDIASTIRLIAKRIKSTVDNPKNSRAVINEAVNKDVIALIDWAKKVTQLNQVPTKELTAEMTSTATSMDDEDIPIEATVTQDPATSAILKAIEALTADVKELKKRQVVTSSVQPSANGGPMTFAEAAAKSVKNAVTSAPKKQQRPAAVKPTATFSCIFKSKDAEDTHEAAQKLFSKKVNLRQMKMGVSKVTKLSHNTVRLEFDSSSERDAVIEAINKADVMTAEVSKKRNPLVIMKGVPNVIDEADLLGTIADQNPAVATALAGHAVDDDMKIRFKRKNFNFRDQIEREHLTNYVIEVTPAVRTALLGLGRVNISYSRVFVGDHNSFLQCYKCYGFGHTTKRCESDHDVCGHCAEHHRTSECTTSEDLKTIKCINCKKSNVKNAVDGTTSHRATSRQCPHVSKMFKRASEMTDYGT